MSHANDILSLASEARPVIEEWLRAAEKIAAFREFATEKEIEWSQLKAVIVASIKDEADSGERLKKLADTADNRLSYAAIFLKTNSATENKIKLSVVWSPPISRETSEQTTEPVASAPPRTPSDGAAVSNSPAPDTAAINPEPATVLSPDLTDSGGTLPDQQPQAPPGDAPTNSVPGAPVRELEGAGFMVRTETGRIEPLGNDGLYAPSSISDDFNDLRGTVFDRNRVEAT